jgi:hypothetical protein
MRLPWPATGATGRSGRAKLAARARRFCRMSCRRAFHAAARRWVLDEIGSGALTVGDIKKGLRDRHTLLLVSSGALVSPRCSTPLTQATEHARDDYRPPVDTSSLLS